MSVATALTAEAAEIRSAIVSCTVSVTFGATENPGRMDSATACAASIVALTESWADAGTDRVTNNPGVPPKCNDGSSNWARVPENTPDITSIDANPWPNR